MKSIVKSYGKFINYLFKKNDTRNNLNIDMSQFNFDKIHLIILRQEQYWLFTKNIWIIHYDDKETIHKGNLKPPSYFKLYDGSYFINTRSIKKIVETNEKIILHLTPLNKVLFFNKKNEQKN